MPTMDHPFRIRMTTELHQHSVEYEVHLDDVLVWRRVVKILPRNLFVRTEAAREQAEIAQIMSLAMDGPWAAVKRLHGDGVVAGARKKRAP